MSPIFHLAAIVALVALFAVPIAAVEPAAPAAGQHYFELRTYITPPGKLAALNARFRDHTCALFKKHGMTLVGFWTPATGPTADNTLIYVLSHASKEAAEASWKAFRADPDWIKAKAASEVDGPLTEKVEGLGLLPTDYSPMK